MPKLSNHVAERRPSAIRNASTKFAERKDGCEAVNVAIGNVSLPMHPAMIERLNNLDRPDSPFCGGVVCYAPTVGMPEARQAFANVLQGSGFDVEKLHVQLTDGGSQGMELLMTGCCGNIGSEDRPVLLVDAAYTNYRSFAQRLNRRVVSMARQLDSSGHFNLPSLHKIEKIIVRENPGALVVIPYDNPTGQLYTHQMMVDFAKLCVKYDLWFISDEAYRELHYVEGVNAPISVWGITEEDAGRKIPKASGTMPHPAENEIVTLVDIDFAAYRRANDLRTVRKNVTLPSWLNDLAERNGVNFSQVLQESLKERLKVSNR